MSHELGHNLSLYHAPCGAGAWLDPSYNSDYHFANGLRFRLSDADSAGLPYLGRQKSLLLWRGVDTDGLPFLEPALVLETPPALPAPGASTISQDEPAAAPSCSP